MPKHAKLARSRAKLIKGFRILRADGCDVAFHAPVELKLPGLNIRGAKNTVRLRIASLADFIVMKAHAIAGRDKPQDSSDLCYCLGHAPAGLVSLAENWRGRLATRDVSRAMEILREKFAAPACFGPQQVVEFYHSGQPEDRAMQARRAYELVREFLNLIEPDQYRR